MLRTIIGLMIGERATFLRQRWTLEDEAAGEDGTASPEQDLPDRNGDDEQLHHRVVGGEQHVGKHRKQDAVADRVFHGSTMEMARGGPVEESLRAQPIGGYFFAVNRPYGQGSVGRGNIICGCGFVASVLTDGDEM